MPDQFEGAESSVEKQRLDALNALATFGRRGLEQAVAAKQASTTTSQGAQQDAISAARGVRGMPAGLDTELAGIAGRALDPYAVSAQRTGDMLSREGTAAGKVQSNYFRQAAEAVPMLRTNAAALEDQYRKAYEERQAAIAAEQARQEEMRQQAAAMLAAEQEQARAANAAAAATVSQQFVPPAPAPAEVNPFNVPIPPTITVMFLGHPIEIPNPEYMKMQQQIRTAGFGSTMAV